MNRILAALAAALLAGCSMASSPPEIASPSASFSPEAKISTLDAPPPTLLPTLDPPPIAVPDPPGGLPVHQPGELVSANGAQFRYSGLVRNGADVWALFRVEGGSLDGARVLLGDSVVPLVLVDEAYRAGPVPEASLDGVATLTVVIGDALLEFEAGKITDG